MQIPTGHPASLGDRLHRSVKMALDSGEVATLEEAYRLFSGYCLQLNVGPEAARSPTLQAALLTAVNTGARCMLGGVYVRGMLDVALLVPWRRCRTLAEAVTDLGAVLVHTALAGTPRVVFGSPLPGVDEHPFALQVTFEGWRGGVVPLAFGRRLAGRQECVPAGVVAGALAVSEAFQHVRGTNVRAGRRSAGVDLWNPGADWMSDNSPGPPLDLLPSRLWLIGLGHLGQAFLWTLGLLPYVRPQDVLLALQDLDDLVEANLSTSPLTFENMLGSKKTRALAAWAEARGFRTVIHERRFAADFRRAGDEPALALCGVDNAEARAALEDVGFARVIEAGLGAGFDQYLAFQIHTFPGPLVARDRWGGGEEDIRAERDLPQAYRALAVEGLDLCGMTTLAGRAVGASFVGVATSALVIAEAVRTAIGEAPHSVIDGSLRLPSDVDAAVNPTRGVANLGYTIAA